MTLSVSQSSFYQTASSGPIRPANLVTMLGVWKQRRALARLDDTRLKDLGISAQQAERESARWFWDLPE